MRSHRFWTGLLLMVLTIHYSTIVAANPLEALAAAGHLSVNSEISPADGIVPGQKVNLTLEIATDRWFSGGTRIDIPEVPGLVILQTEQFASNASEIRNGETWVVQRWTLDVFPQRPGEFTLGAIPLQIKVNTEAAGDVEGVLLSPSSSFRVTVPASLMEIGQWLAAPTFTVTQSFNRSLDNLAVGDAFEQEVIFAASDVLAMMLPTYASQAPHGLAAYPSPPVLDNTANRGRSLATRKISISYVVEQPGQYLLPAQDYFWWNTQTTALELLSLPETRINVVGVSTAGEDAATMFRINRGQLLTLLLGLILLAAVLWFTWRLGSRLPLAKWAAYLSTRWQQLRTVFKPALAERLNPGSSAGD